MRLIIAGSRGIDGEDAYQKLRAFVRAKLPCKPVEVVSGGAKGVDTLGERFAAEHNIPVRRFIPDWDKHGKGAGFIRNGDMAVYASESPGSVLVAYWDGQSNGTRNMIEVAKNYGLQVFVLQPEVATIPVKDVTPEIFPQSHSSLSTFKNCPRQYEAKYIIRDVKFVQNAAAKWGDDVHLALESFIVNGTPLPANMAQYQPALDWVMRRAEARQGVVLAERKSAIDKVSKGPVPYSTKDAWIRAKIDVTILYEAQGEAEVFDWKGLALDTPLPTPTGWTTMGSVAVGDALYDDKGRVCHVTGKSQVKHLPCYVVRFDDTTEVVCDEEHLWALNDGRVVPVTALTTKDRVALTQPVEGIGDPALDAYALGVWLADGKRSSGEVSKPDGPVWQELERRGFSFGANTGATCPTRTVLGLRGELRKLGVLGNKHIPECYMRAPVGTRLDLLRGLMDGDGYANPTRKQAILQLVDERLAKQAAELALSLGERVGVRKVRGVGFGKDVVSWQVAWRPVVFNPFLDPRKAAVIAAAMGTHKDRFGREWGARNYRRVVSVTEVPSVATQCIAVDSPNRTFLCSRNWVPTHNTGKPKDDDTQLALYAGCTLADYRPINTVKSGYIWLQTMQPSKPLVLERADYFENWRPFEAQYAQLVRAYETGVFPPKPSGLCAWCDVKRCEFWKPRPAGR